MKNLKKLLTSMTLAFSFATPVTAQSEFKVSRLSLTEGQVFTIPSGTEDIAFSELEMGQGSQLNIPADINHITIVIDNGVFHRGSSIVSLGSEGSRGLATNEIGGSGESAASMTIKVNRAEFLLAGDGSDLGKPFFLVSSIGGIGGEGGMGSKGSDARRKGCKGTDGAPAASGGSGAAGGTGGDGGAITLDVELIPGHPTISNKEIALRSVAGEGGPGGQGGDGGAGVGGKCCGQVLGQCTFRRGGYGAGSKGSTGPTGSGGSAVEPILNLDFG